MINAISSVSRERHQGLPFYLKVNPSQACRCGYTLARLKCADRSHASKVVHPLPSLIFSIVIAQPPSFPLHSLDVLDAFRSVSGWLTVLLSDILTSFASFSLACGHTPPPSRLRNHNKLQFSTRLDSTHATRPQLWVTLKDYHHPSTVSTRRLNQCPRTTE